MTSDVAVAIAAAVAGAAVARASYGSPVARTYKSATDFATEVDIAAEEAIRRVIRRARPSDGFLGEETGVTGGQSGRHWLVDPLCGTLNYAATTPLASVNVALVTRGGVSASAVADPIGEEVFWADADNAWLRTARRDMALVPSPSSGLVEINCDGPLDRPFVGGALVADPRLRAAFGPRVISSTLGVAWVAAGRRAAYITDGWLEGSVHFTAGIQLCRAAGCVVTDLAGDQLHRGPGLIAAADAETHAQLVEIVEPHLVH